MILNRVKEAKPRLCFLVLAAFLSLNGIAQEQMLSGKVYDQDSVGIAFAKLVNEEFNVTETTDFEGQFSFSVPLAMDSIKVFVEGYVSQVVAIPADGSALTVTLESSMSVISVEATKPKVVVDTEYVIREDPSMINVITTLPIVRIVSRQYMQNPLGSKVFPVAAIGAQEIASTNQFSMQDAINQLPGVKMDSRGYNGSRRLNLRGTLTRSPFGVRNVRMTMNGFPLTSSDGSSALELLEPADIKEMNIYKGPTGSYEMTGTGGVLALVQKSKKSGQYEVQLGAAEFGVLRAYAAAGVGKNKFTGTISAVHSQNTGYRNHEANDKSQITFTGRYESGKKLSYDLLAMLYDGYWELPGHITLEEVEASRTLSNSYSQEHDAHVARRRAYVGVHQKWRISDNFINDTRVFTQFTDKLNPYGTFRFFQGLKDETAQEFGGRTEFKYFPGVLGKVILKGGTQWQYFTTEIKEYVNDLGEKGDLKYDNSTNITEGIIFGSAQWNPVSKLEAVGQVGYNLYTVVNKGVNSDNVDLAFTVSNKQKLLPRVGVSYQLINRYTFATASYAQGIAYPSIFEWVDTGSGKFSDTLNPEESDNFEVGFSTKLKNQKIDFSVNAYTGRVTETITERETEEGAVFFENAGESIQQGVEVQASYNHIKAGNVITFYASSALSNYEFVDDDVDEKLRVAGIVPVTVSSGVRWKRERFEVNIHGRYIGEFATVVGEETNPETDYVLLNGKVSYSLNVAARGKLTLEAGVNNILDATYTSFYRLNATGKIYNPMAARNVFLGVSFKRI